MQVFTMFVFVNLGVLTILDEYLRDNAHSLAVKSFHWGPIPSRHS